ncbi:hypothetical protein L2E82_10309 [Cichorium intybus]|uniref:Uncharacterized protein n=1 Tax=Cichorium intybus TaxID=13427 RepID=A0ACB9GB86_CICIN|nr:hypothetical protein L2E82_10309 [Cichorium intybus]
MLQKIEEGKTYNLVLYIRSLESINGTVSLTDSIGVQTLATTNIIESDVSDWTKIEAKLKAKGSNANSRLQLKTDKKGVIWFDQVSLMPTDTYKGHGFWNDHFKMVADMKPGFIRFPGGCFVEEEYLRNAFRWKETVGSWEERPAEDLGAAPIWEALDGIKFARGDPNSTWGSVRPKMGHPEPFDLKYVAIGNEDCWLKNYRGQESGFLHLS